MKKTKIKLLFVMLFILTIALVHILFTSEIDKQGKEKIENVSHTHEVILETKEYLSAMKDMETGQRGYLLTNDKSYLEPYTIGIVQAKESFSKLSALTSDNKNQVDRLKLINKYMQLKFKELESTINITNHEEAIRIVKRDDGKKYMDQIRRIVALVVNEEVELLSKRERELFNNSLIHIYIFKASTFLLILVLFYFVYRNLMRKYEVEEVNKSLELKIKEEVEKNTARNTQLIQQSRQAQLGEMISMIAHQWRQPLGSISSAAINLQMNIELEKFDLSTVDGQKQQNIYFSNELKNIDELVQNLTTTIDDFRNFYKPNKKSEIVKAEDLIEKSLKIIKSALVSDNIKIIKQYDSQEEIKVYNNEMMQVILNILKNAQDNFLEKNTENPCIKIITKNRKIFISDNGGGVDENIVDKIFDPYFSTKTEKNGTGLGLYMSKIIVEDHHHGKLSVKNTDGGAMFIIEIGIFK